jgi:hypothetical protein
VHGDVHVLPSTTSANPAGADVTVTVTLGVNVTVAVAYLVGSAALSARRVTTCGELITAGAMYSPIGEMLPAPPFTMLQFTAVLVVPVTVAVNSCC